MAFQATFHYNNLDATSDLNLHTRALVAKGVITGFDVTPVASTVNVTVAPGYLVSADGMIVRSTATENVACVAGVRNNLVFRAVYNAPAAPTLVLQVLSDAQYASDPEQANLIILAVIDLTVATAVSNAVISYATSDRVDVQKRSQFLGVYATAAVLTTAYPSAAPVRQRNGDYALVISDDQAKPAFYIWTGGAWITLGNYEELLLSYNLHTAGVTNAGLNAHVTNNEKAAIGGTSGVPGPSNRFVTETDFTRLTTQAQKDAIDNAISGPNPISASNPLIADGIPVAVPRVVGVTATAATDTLIITYADTGNSVPYFGVPVYTGKLGLDANRGNRSSARHWFKLQDSFLAGYFDEDGPLYVDDILDSTGSGSFNAAADAAVSGIGYWKPSLDTTALRIKLNRTLAAGKTVYISYYASGSISTLAPQNAYKTPATAQSMAADAYREINTAIVTNLTAEYLEAGRIVVDAGTAAIPGLQFRDASNTDTGSGLYYIGNINDNQYSLYNAVGVSVSSDTVVVFAKSNAGDNPELDTEAAPLVFEQYADGSTVRYRVHVYEHEADLAPSVIEFGTSSYASGFTAASRLGKLSSTFYGTEFMSSVRFVAGRQLQLAAGTAALPSVTFGTDLSTGIYQVGTYGESDLSLYRGIGISLNARTAFVFASNTPNATGISTFDSPLLFEQFQDTSDSSVGYRIAITRASASAPEAASIDIGVASYSNDFTAWLSARSTGTTISRKLDVTGNISFGNAGYGVLAATAGTFTLALSSASLLSYAGGVFTINAATTTLAGKLTLDAGTEAAPSISFGTTADTGLFYIGNYSSGGVATRRAVGVSIEGSVVLMIGRNEANPGTIGTLNSPLLIEQSVNGGQTELRLAAVDRTAEASTLVLGVANYVQDFIPGIVVSASRVTCKIATYMEATLRGVAAIFTSTISAAGITSGGSVNATGASASAVAFALGGTSDTGLYGNTASIGLALGGSPVLFTSNIGGLHLESSLALKLGGRLTANDIVTTAGAGIGTALSVGGAATFGAGITVTGLATINGPITVNGLATLNGGAHIPSDQQLVVVGTSNFTGDITALDITAGTLDASLVQSKNNILAFTDPATRPPNIPDTLNVGAMFVDLVDTMGRVNTLRTFRQADHEGLYNTSDTGIDTGSIPLEAGVWAIESAVCVMADSLSANTTAQIRTYFSTTPGNNNLDGGFDSRAVGVGVISSAYTDGSSEDGYRANIVSGRLIIAVPAQTTFYLRIRRFGTSITFTYNAVISAIKISDTGTVPSY